MKLINICGLSRSGSTMLDLMLGNDPSAFSLGEIYALYRPFRRHHLVAKCSCGSNECPWHTIKQLPERDFHYRCFQILRVKYLIDSSKHLPWVIDNNIQARTKGIEVFNIAIFKNEMSLYYSFWKRKTPLITVRKRFVKYYGRLLETNMPFVSVNYDALVEDPGSYLKRLCNIVGLPYFRGKERFWEKEHHHLFGSLGLRREIMLGTTKIKVPDYPKEFLKEIMEAERSCGCNEEFQSMQRLLANRELKVESTTTSVIRRPLWYYKIKMLGRIRSFLVRSGVSIR